MKLRFHESEVYLRCLFLLSVPPSSHNKIWLHENFSHHHDTRLQFIPQNINYLHVWVWLILYLKCNPGDTLRLYIRYESILVSEYPEQSIGQVPLILNQTHLQEVLCLFFWFVCFQFFHLCSLTARQPNPLFFCLCAKRTAGACLQNNNCVVQQLPGVWLPAFNTFQALAFEHSPL